jgi:hypothetical protein
MKVSDLYCGIEDGLDMSGEIISIDVVKANNKPISLNIKATCPNYPEVSCGYYQISLSDIPECSQSVCSENVNYHAPKGGVASRARTSHTETSPAV